MPPEELSLRAQGNRIVEPHRARAGMNPMLRFDTLAVAGFVRLANEMASERRAWKRGDS